LKSREYSGTGPNPSWSQMMHLHIRPGMFSCGHQGSIPCLISEIQNAANSKGRGSYRILVENQSEYLFCLFTTHLLLFYYPSTTLLPSFTTPLPFLYYPLLPFTTPLLSGTNLLSNTERPAAYSRLQETCYNRL
jgi:hypothetical protein